MLPCPPDQIDEFLSEPPAGLDSVLARHPGDITVAGAAGKMGGTLTLMLAKALRRRHSPHTVTAVSRFSSPAARAFFEDRGVRTLACDLTDRTAVAALPQTPIVFFLAGHKFGTGNAPELTWAMNTVAPAHAADHWRGARIVAFSTGCVYSLVEVTGRGSAENSPTEPPGEYAHSCLGREGVFRFFSKRHGTPVALMRLNYSVEFRYGVLLDIAQKVLAGDPVDLTMSHVNVIWQRDACAHAVHCLDLAGSPAVPVNVTGPDVISVRTLADELGKLLGKTPRFTGTPAPRAWLNDAAMSHERFGPPETKLPEMLAWTAAWLQSGGTTLGKPTHFEAGDGKF